MLNNGRMETNATEYPVFEYESYVRCMTATCCIVLDPLFSVNPFQWIYLMREIHEIYFIVNGQPETICSCTATATAFDYTHNPFWNKWVCLYLSRNRQRQCQTTFVYFHFGHCLVHWFNYLWYISTLIDIIQLTFSFISIWYSLVYPF